MARWRSRRPDWKYGAQGPPTFGPSSQSSPSQRRPSRMPSIMSSDERSASVSSMRRTKTPPSRRAKSQLKSAVRAPPTCKCPVGEGAKRTRGAMSGKLGGEAGIRTLDTAFRPYNGLANRRLQPLGHLTADFQVYVTQILTRKRWWPERAMTVRIKTAAFDAKFGQQSAMWRRHDHTSGHTVLGTLLGTHGAFFARSDQKTEGKRDKATVFLTVA